MKKIHEWLGAAAEMLLPRRVRRPLAVGVAALFLVVASSLVCPPAACAQTPIAMPSSLVAQKVHAVEQQNAEVQAQAKRAEEERARQWEAFREGTAQQVANLFSFDFKRDEEGNVHAKLGPLVIAPGGPSPLPISLPAPPTITYGHSKNTEIKPTMTTRWTEVRGTNGDSGYYSYTTKSETYELK